MNRSRDRLQVLLGILLAENVTVIRVDEHIQLVTTVEHDKLGTALGGYRRQVLFDRALWIGGLDPVEQVIGRHRVVSGRDVEQAAVHQ
ncbi:hypothetical protein D3C76_1486410 [compost metagenome]